ncbi:uncharacterized protein BDR25DRAFT_382221 [Lindgomyces ingoldianus]|uniref:Uncharacterized protein n=1 Tax=Lindgomyces ingoldianus TaxID=673940 RepID=A0ACB6R9U0_9PLEO|nr:uncharacterized protein BDR25DRAFT_382221 [Lindgomyces ingoldianus]KAF2475287.1 hypothetical protein BDR25DRAFT_382221 [Lindgomyces ingoldianus]
MSLMNIRSLASAMTECTDTPHLRLSDTNQRPESTSASDYSVKPSDRSNDHVGEQPSEGISMVDIARKLRFDPENTATELPTQHRDHNSGRLSDPQRISSDAQYPELDMEGFEIGHFSADAFESESVNSDTVTLLRRQNSVPAITLTPASGSPPMIDTFTLAELGYPFHSKLQSIVPGKIDRISRRRKKTRPIPLFNLDKNPELRHPLKLCPPDKGNIQGFYRGALQRMKLKNWELRQCVGRFGKVLTGISSKLNTQGGDTSGQDVPENISQEKSGDSSHDLVLVATKKEHIWKKINASLALKARAKRNEEYNGGKVTGDVM